MSYQLVALGNPLLDLQVNVDAEYLKKYDLKSDDAILAEEKHLPIYDELIKKDDLVLVAGGAAQNTARGAQYILPAKSVVYFGSVGNDVYAKKLNEANAKYGLRTEYQIQPDIETGKCAASVSYTHLDVYKRQVYTSNRSADPVITIIFFLLSSLVSKTLQLGLFNNTNLFGQKSTTGPSS